jgi:site-specific DNA recombinase
MNSIIYIRVSTTEQAEHGYSLKDQLETCLDYAGKNNYKVLRVFSEKGESAKTTNRTELKKLLEFVNLKSGDIKYLIVYKLDRLSRNLLDYTNLINLLSKHNISLKSATESISETPEGELMQNIIASFAQFDNQQRGRRTRSGMIQAVKDGRYVWKAPIGYINNKIEGGVSLLPTDEKIIIEKIFNDFARGKKQHEIIKDLSHIGIKIAKQSLKKILLNPVYIAKIKTSFFDFLVNGDWEPIVDEVVFYKVQDILAKKSLSYVFKERTDDFPLRKLLLCPECNSKLTGSWSKGRSKKYPYYHCTKKGCRFKPVRKEKVEKLFNDFLRLLEPADRVLDDFSKAARDFVYSKKNINDKMISSLERKLNELEIKKARIEDLAIEGTFSKERFIIKINEVEKDIAKKKVEIDNTQKENIDIESVLDYFRYFVKNLASLWNESDLDRKRRFQDYIFPKGIYIENNILRTTQLNPVIKALEDYKDRVINSLSPMVAHRGLEPLF